MLGVCSQYPEWVLYEGVRKGRALTRCDSNDVDFVFINSTHLPNPSATCALSMLAAFCFVSCILTLIYFLLNAVQRSPAIYYHRGKLSIYSGLSWTTYAVVYTG